MGPSLQLNHSAVQKALANRLRTLRNEPSASTDCVLFVGNGTNQLGCHAAVLAAASPVLEAILSAQWEKSAHAGETCVSWKCSAAAAKVILDLAYLGEADCADGHVMEEVAHWARALEVTMPNLQPAGKVSD